MISETGRPVAARPAGIALRITYQHRTDRSMTVFENSLQASADLSFTKRGMSAFDEVFSSLRRFNDP